MWGLHILFMQPRILGLWPCMLHNNENACSWKLCYFFMAWAASFPHLFLLKILKSHILCQITSNLQKIFSFHDSLTMLFEGFLMLT
uniref:Uncharacterized protein n=1 Tax=Rhizophora mucronata TaxID=61149 RepID=A0A2P2PWN7_RHIMU